MCVSVRAHDKRIACDEEFSDSEDEAEGHGGGRRNSANHKKVKRVKKEEEKEGEEKKGKVSSFDENLILCLRCNFMYHKSRFFLVRNFKKMH